jgi:hypothetical protein
VGFGAAGPAVINDIIHLGTADAVRYVYSKKIIYFYIGNIIVVFDKRLKISLKQAELYPVEAGVSYLKSL